MDKKQRERERQRDEAADLDKIALLQESGEGEHNQTLNPPIHLHMDGNTHAYVVGDARAA